MTQPRNCDRFALISGAMSLTEREIWRHLQPCRPENSTDTAVHLVQKLYTLLIYQGVRIFSLLCLPFYIHLSIAQNTRRVKQSRLGSGRHQRGAGCVQQTRTTTKYLTPLTAFVCQQIACNLVGKFGRFLPLNRRFNY